MKHKFQLIGFICLIVCFYGLNSTASAAPKLSISTGACKINTNQVRIYAAAHSNIKVKIISANNNFRFKPETNYTFLLYKTISLNQWQQIKGRLVPVRIQVKFNQSGKWKTYKFNLTLPYSRFDCD